jgi:rare lipoprotein A
MGWTAGSRPAPAKATGTISSTGITPATLFTQSGVASYYGERYQGRKTANGEIFDMNKLTAAHRSLPFGVVVRVTNLTNNRAVLVRINDRGPYVGDRIIDLSLEAARQLDMVAAGILQVRVEAVDAKGQADVGIPPKADDKRLAALTPDHHLSRTDSRSIPTLP